VANELARRPANSSADQAAATRATGCSRIGRFSNAAAAASTMSAYHIQL